MMRPVLCSLSTVVAIVTVVVACGPEPGPSADALAVDEARREYPRFVDVQQYIVGPTCAPNVGVCHNTNNYPDLHTPGNTLTMLRAFCNVELPDPALGWNECERQGDRVLVGDDDVEVAYVDKEGGLRWRLGLREALSDDVEERPTIETATGETVLEPLGEWNVVATGGAGDREIVISIGSGQPFIDEFVANIMDAVIGGDPNRDAVFGGSEETILPGALVMPGNLERSYFWGRITGTVPGSRMPLANDPLTYAQYVAIACWIETLDDDASVDDDPEAAIDYDNCDFAAAPIDYTRQ